MQTYTTTEQGFAKIRRNIIGQWLLIFGFLIVILIGWEVRQIEADEKDLTSLFIILTVLIGTNIFIIRQTIV